MPVWASNFYWRAETRSADISAYIGERCYCFYQVQDPAMRSAPFMYGPRFSAPEPLAGATAQARPSGTECLGVSPPLNGNSI